MVDAALMVSAELSYEVSMLVSTWLLATMAAQDAAMGEQSQLQHQPLLAAECHRNTARLKEMLVEQAGDARS